MKKCILILAVCLSLSACGTKKSQESNSEYEISETEDKNLVSDNNSEYKSSSITSSKIKSYSSSDSFTNKYGTSTTKCAVAGCENYIASSGDTNCCTTHSNKCGICNKYIDGDAMYCMDCIISEMQ